MIGHAIVHTFLYLVKKARKSIKKRQSEFKVVPMPLLKKVKPDEVQSQNRG